MKNVFESYLSLNVLNGTLGIIELSDSAYAPFSIH